MGRGGKMISPTTYRTRIAHEYLVALVVANNVGQGAEAERAAVKRAFRIADLFIEERGNDTRRSRQGAS